LYCSVHGINKKKSLVIKLKANDHDSALWTRFTKRSISKVQYFIDCFEEDTAIFDK